MGSRDYAQAVAYLYDSSGNLLQTFSDPDGSGGDTFGSSVAGEGNNILVGASGANQAQGAVYVYDSSGDLLQTLSEPNGSPEDYFGISVAAAGANVVIGAPGANGGQGAAYFYLGTLTKSTTSTTLTDNGPNLSTYGDSLNFTVNVSPSQGSVP